LTCHSSYAKDLLEHVDIISGMHEHS
jgi:hypothetical protein